MAILHEACVVTSAVQSYCQNLRALKTGTNAAESRMCICSCLPPRNDPAQFVPGRDGDYADPHTSEESPRIMARRRGRRAGRPRPSDPEVDGGADAAASTESSKRDATPSRPTPALAVGRNAFALATPADSAHLTKPSTQAALASCAPASHLTPRVEYSRRKPRPPQSELNL